MRLVSITTTVLSSNPAHVKGHLGRGRMVVESCELEVYSMQHYVIKFVSDLVQVGGLSVTYGRLVVCQ